MLENVILMQQQMATQQPNRQTKNECPFSIEKANKFGCLISELTPPLLDRQTLKLRGERRGDDRSELTLYFFSERLTRHRSEISRKKCVSISVAKTRRWWAQSGSNLVRALIPPPLTKSPIIQRKSCLANIPLRRREGRGRVENKQQRSRIRIFGNIGVGRGGKY